MPDAFLTALHEWQNFYLLLGTAAATLIGLLFVALSLGSSLVLADRVGAVRTFMTPNLFLFTSVLMIAALCNIPILHAGGILGVLLLPVGAVGMVRIGIVLLGFAQHSGIWSFERSHWVWFVLAPGSGYGLVLASAAAMQVATAEQALTALAVATIVLLLTGIRNTWDLMVWIASHRASTPDSPDV